MFRTVLEEILAKVPGALSVALMGVDGIPIEEARVPADRQAGLNVDLIAAEYAALQKRIAKTNQGLDLTEVREFQIVTDRLAVLLNMVSAEYFLLLLMDRAAGTGRARYELHRAQLRLEAELV